MTDTARAGFQPIEPQGEAAIPRDSATIIVARDSSDGLEVFMLERHLDSDFAGGAYVFPGGKIDDRDRDPDLAGVVDGWEDLARAMAEADPDLARALIVCAIRETFEESGVLLATRDGESVRLEDEPSWAADRTRLAAGEIGALDLARETGIRYAAHLLRFWARWITPVFAPKRYDTRFFVAHMPAGQRPLHDDVETTASAWVRPPVALRKAREGAFTVIFPTRKTLEAVGAHATANALFAAATGRATDPILPTIGLLDGQPKVRFPGDDATHDP
jgi:8-oxo-dGTP pyrophosphatase MutT (NUDIX family)